MRNRLLKVKKSVIGGMSLSISVIVTNHKFLLSAHSYLSRLPRSKVPAPSPVRPAQHSFERLSELGTKYRINNGIQGRIEIPKPKKETHNVRVDVTGVTAQRHDERDYEKRQPTHDEGPRDYGERFCRLPLPLRLYALFLLLPGRQQLVHGCRTHWDFLRQDLHPADVADVALMTGGAIVGGRSGRLLRRDVVGDGSAVVDRHLRMILRFGYRERRGFFLFLLAVRGFFFTFLFHYVHRGCALTLRHHQRRNQRFRCGRFLAFALL